MTEASEADDEAKEPEFDQGSYVSFEEFSLYYETTEKVTDR